MSYEKSPIAEPEGRIEGNKPQGPLSKENENKDSSFTDRVGKSASGLLQSFSGRSEPTTISSDLASLHASTSKGESNSTPRNGGTSAPLETFSLNKAQDKTTGFSENAGSFRTTAHDRSRVQETFDDWARSSVNLPKSNLMSSNTFESFNGHIKIDKGKMAANNDSKATGDGKYGDIVESDGASVTSLLSRASLNVDDLPSDNWEPRPQSQEFDTDNNWLTDRSNLENSAASNFKGRSPPESNGSQFSKKKRQPNQYDLIPNFDDPTREGRTDIWKKHDWNEYSDSERNRIGIAMSTVEEQIKPWLALMTDYQDEVWGCILPQLHEEREKLKNPKENKDQPLKNFAVGPAIQRLQMVLRHISNP